LVHWIPHDVLAKLKAIRRAGDSYSDVIVALAEETAGR
jgi:predicted CopG family antitoxin